MKTLFVFLALALTTTAFAKTTQQLLQDIADNADVANGNAEVKKGSFNQKAADAQMKNWKSRWDNCTFTKPYVDDKALSSLLKYSDDSVTVNAIKELQKSHLVTKVYGYETDNDIACSQVWINVYTKDGYVLELWYGLGD
ncbi:MAG: hypothetical protein ACJ76H_00850 [Bacteriovoracaceae bacterium]